MPFTFEEVRALFQRALRAVRDPDEFGFLGVKAATGLPGTAEADGYIYDVPYHPGYTYARIAHGTTFEPAEVIVIGTARNYYTKINFFHVGGALIGVAPEADSAVAGLGTAVSGASFDINSLTEDDSPASGDFVPFYDISTGLTKKTPASSLGGGGASSGLYGDLPASPSTGDIYWVTDAPISLIYDGSNWLAKFGTYNITLPTTSGWTLHGGSMSTPATINTSYGIHYLYTGAPASGFQWAYQSRTPTYPVVFAVRSLKNVNYSSGEGMVGWRESSSGKMVLFNWYDGGGYISKYPDDTTAAVGDYVGFQYFYEGSEIRWIKLDDDGSNRKIYVSANGGLAADNWLLVHSVGNTDYITADQIVWGGKANDKATPQPGTVMLLSFAEG